MTKNKYEYICPHCGEQVSSLTRHYKKEHPEHMSEALKDGMQQRMAAGMSNPIQNMGKKKAEPKVAETVVMPKTVPKKKKTPKKKVVEEVTPSEEGSFLDLSDII